MSDPQFKTEPLGKLGIIALQGCEEMAKKIDYYLVRSRKDRQNDHFDGYQKDSYIIETEFIRFGTGEGKWVSMGVPSDGSYGVEKGLIFSFPVSIKPGGAYTIAQGLTMDNFAKQKMEATQLELIEERDQALEACIN